MMRRLIVLLILLAGCTMPEVTNTPPVATSTSTVAPTDTPTATPTETATASPSPTSGPSPTSDIIQLYYPDTITVTPWAVEGASPMIRCLLLHYDFEFRRGLIIVNRRDQAGYFECVKES